MKNKIVSILLGSMVFILAGCQGLSQNHAYVPEMKGSEVAESEEAGSEKSKDTEKNSETAKEEKISSKETVTTEGVSKGEKQEKTVRINNEKSDKESNKENNKEERTVREENTEVPVEEPEVYEQAVSGISESVITGTFSRMEGGVMTYPAYYTESGEQVFVNVDMEAPYPSWEGYEKDVLKILNLEEDKFRVTGAYWLGDSYWGTETNPETNQPVAVEYRDAAYSFEVIR